MELSWSAAQAARPKPTPEPLAFTAKTAAALAEQVSIARAARRSVAHRVCDDRSPCRHCLIVRDAHRSINDHLDQLEVVALEHSLDEG